MLNAVHNPKAASVIGGQLVSGNLGEQETYESHNGMPAINYSGGHKGNKNYMLQKEDYISSNYEQYLKSLNQ